MYQDEVADAMIELRRISMNLGEGYKTINTIELYRILKSTSSIQITIEELNVLIPSICYFLDMECYPLYDVKNKGCNVTSYKIILY